MHLLLYMKTRCSQADFVVISACTVVKVVFYIDTMQHYSRRLYEDCSYTM